MIRVYPSKEGALAYLHTKNTKGFFGVYFLKIYVKLYLHILQLNFSTPAMLLSAYRECHHFPNLFTVTLGMNTHYSCTYHHEISTKLMKMATVTKQKPLMII